MKKFKVGAIAVATAIGFGSVSLGVISANEVSTETVLFSVDDIISLIKSEVRSAKDAIDKRLDKKIDNLTSKADKDKRKAELKANKDRNKKYKEANEKKEPVILLAEEEIKLLQNLIEDEKKIIDNNFPEEEAFFKKAELDRKFKEGREDINAKARLVKDKIDEDLAKEIKPIDDKEDKDCAKIDKDLRKDRSKARDKAKKDKEKVVEKSKLLIAAISKVSSKEEALAKWEEFKVQVEEIANPKPAPKEEERPKRDPLKKKETKRISGKTRIHTAIEISKENYDSAKNVVIVSKDNFADALSATVLAGNYKAPILFVDKEELANEVSDELLRLGVENAYIIGGESSISDLVRAQIHIMDIKVERISGDDRYETSKEIAKKVFENTKKKDTAILANGEAFADAIAVCPLAIEKQVPIILVKKDVLPEPAKLALEDVKEVYIAGGSKSISEGLETQLPKVVERFDGANRFETAVKIAKASYKKPSRIYIVNADFQTDALATGTAAAKSDAPILFVQKNSVVDHTLEYLEEHSIKDIHLIGGDNSISKEVEKEVKEN